MMKYKTKNKRAIYSKEYVKINGIYQYLFHCGTNPDNPVMLFLHGGPGNPESLYAHYYQKKWEELYTVVHWEQRGSGKTLIKNPDKYPTIDIIMDDLLKVVQYIKRYYNKQKIVIIGHSWGSVLGSLFIRKYPEEVDYYIGVGQVINMIKNELVGYEKLKEKILVANDKKSLLKLKKIGDYPERNLNDNFITKIKKVRKLQGKYNLTSKLDLKTIKTAFKSPVFKFTDIIALIKGLKANEQLLKFLFEFDQTTSIEYQVPIYYILGENDWQTPYVIAEEYFKKIIAPSKKIYLIPNAGHATMFDQPELFSQIIKEINEIQCAK